VARAPDCPVRMTIEIASFLSNGYN
jgi:hypothetical protein